MSEQTRVAVPKGQKPEAPADETAVSPAVETDKVETVVDTTAPAIVADELPAPVTLDEAKVIVLADAPPAKVFALTIKQRDENGQEIMSYGIKFSLPADIAMKIDYVVGTAIDQLFRQMDTAQACKVKLFKAKLPLDISIATEDNTNIADFGKVDQRFLAKIKVNKGERSKLALIETLIALSNSMFTEIRAIRSTTLREDAKIEVANRFGKETKGQLSQGDIINMVKAEVPALAVEANGELVEA